MDHDSVRLGKMVNGRYFYLKRESGSPQHVLMMASQEDKSDERPVVSPLEHNPAGTDSIMGFYPSPDGKLVAYLLCESGQDYCSLLVRNVETGQDYINDTIHQVGWYEHQLFWDENNTGFRYLAKKKEPNGHGEEVFKHHIVGTSSKQDNIVTELHMIDGWLRAHNLNDEVGAPSAYEWVTLTSDYHASNGLYFRPKGSDEAYDELLNSGVYFYKPVGMRDGKVLVVTNHGAPAGKLVAVDVKNPDPAHWVTIIPQQKDHYLKSAVLHQGKILARYMYDAASKVSVYDQQGQHLHDMPLALQAMVGFGSASNEDPKIPVQLVQPDALETTGFYNPHTNELVANPSILRCEDTIVERHYAISKDGTKVPMTIMRHKDTPLDGSAAVLMTGYGGFNIHRPTAMTMESYNWVNEGGIYVQTNLRGGGEYDREWYDQGKLLNKQNVFDDFAACAEHLIEQNYTTSQRLAITGGSNGGLLTLAASHQRPELFGAVVSHVPVTDMLCAHWREDYGYPDGVKEDFEYVMKYSPLHTIRGDVAYPPTLVTTADHDDRVSPLEHAYKYVATRNQIAPDTLCLLRVGKDAGHGIGKSQAQEAKGLVEDFIFLEQALGPINPEKFKAAMAAAGEGKWAKSLKTSQPTHSRIAHTATGVGVGA